MNQKVFIARADHIKYDQRKKGSESVRSRAGFTGPRSGPMPTGPSHGQDITTLRGRSGIISNTPSEPEEGLEYLEKVLEKVATPPGPGGRC